MFLSPFPFPFYLYRKRMMSNFLDLFDNYMTKMGYSNGWMAWKSGLARQTIIRWRHEIVKKPNCEKVRKVMMALQLTPQEQHEFLEAAGCQRDKPATHFLPIICNPIYSPNQLFG